MERLDMKLSLIGTFVLAILLLGCGGGDAEETDTAVAEPEAPATAEEGQPDQTALTETIPETTPENAPDTTAPAATPTTSPSAADTDYDYGAGTGGTAGTDTTSDTGASAGGEIQAVESELGQIIADAEGMTLYIFLPDEQSESTCYDACAATWPPLEGEVQAGAGVDESMIGTTERTDGTIQATYNGWPLYYFASDTAPGDVNGQGVGDNWFVIDPAGEVVDG